MKTTGLFLLSALCFVQAQAHNLPQHPTKAYRCDDCLKLSHETLHTRWPINETSLKPIPHEHKSYSYNQQVSAAQLRQGVSISTRAPGAVVRITPLERKTMPQLEIKAKSRPFVALKEAAALYAQDEALADSFAMDEHQIMMQIKPELGFGTFVIKSKNSARHDADAYLIHVFDKYSLIYLQVEPDATTYQYGDQFSALISLKDNDNEYDLSEVHAALVSTDEQKIPLKLTRIKRNRFKVSTTLTSELNTHGDNWYIEATVESIQDGGFLHRTARTAFSYSIPSASLLSITKQPASTPLTFNATLDVATASRYALQGVLFRTNSAGETVPVEISQNAQWLEPGTQTIKFSFDNLQQFDEDTLSVGYLHLTDYGQLKTVYHYDQPIKISQLMD